MRRYILFVLFLAPTLNANVLFDTTDNALDIIDPVATYERLSEVIKSEVTPDEFYADGCSGEISKVWNEQIFPKYIKSKLKGASDESVPFPVEYCCIEHDISYHRAYLKSEKIENPNVTELNALELRRHRKNTDLKFRNCIAKKENKAKFIKAFSMICLPENATEIEISEKQKHLAKKINLQQIADLMYVGVRFGGRPCSNHEYRFGYGYSNCENAGTSTFDTSLKVFLDMLKN